MICVERLSLCVKYIFNSTKDYALRVFLCAIRIFMSENNVHTRLEQARKDAGYATAREAAEALGISYPTYAAHETDSAAWLALLNDMLSFLRYRSTGY